MYKKIVGIVVLTLLTASALPVVGTINIERSESIQFESKSSSTDIVWSDNFDSYSLGQLLDGDPEDGGWKICHCPYPSEGAYVVDDQSLSNPHSVEIVGESDIIHEFSGIYSGNWTFTDWIYVPAEFSEACALALDSYMPDPWVNELVFRQLAVVFNGDTGFIECYPTGPTLPLITDQWVELRIEFDLEADWLECYYNDEILIAKNWTEDIIWGTGFRNLAAVTLSYTQSYGPMDTPIYHDDFSIDGEGSGLIPNLQCEGSLSWTCKKGATVTGNFTVKNIGDANSRLEWIIDECPDFGTWTCDPFKGSLTPEDGELTVTATLEAPKKVKDYNGVIKVIAVGDPDDFCEIPVQVNVPRDRAINFNLFDLMFERFPNAFLILRQLFGL